MKKVIHIVIAIPKECSWNTKDLVQLEEYLNDGWELIKLSNLVSSTFELTTHVTGIAILEKN